MTTLFLDCETFSDIPISRGTYRYSEGVEVMLWAYAIDDGPIKVWDLTLSKSMPSDLYLAWDSDATIYAHNAQFDRTMLEHCGYHSDLSRWRCSMAQAYAHSLPGSLDALCTVFRLGTDTAKDKEGKKLIQLFCMPRKTGKIVRATRETHPIEWTRFIEYARLDIASMREIVKKMPNWNYQGEELRLWHLDQKINLRGYRVDTDLAHEAIRAVARAQTSLADRTETLSYGDLGSTTQRDETLRHIVEAYGVELPDLTAATVERRMEDPDLPPELKELLAIRLQASSTSTAKYRKLIDCVSSDGRLRGTMQFCAAGRTGRWGGRLFQPQNLKRPTMSFEDIDFGIKAIKADGEDFFFENVMELCSNTVRGCITAGEGKKLVISDLASIEGRVLPWLAGEQSELDAYAAYDLGAGPDIYKLTYGRAFRINPDLVTKAQRQIGKVMTLMLGFQGSVGAFLTGAATYGIDLTALATGLEDALPDQMREKGENSWEWAIKEKRTFDLEKEVYVVCRALTEMWRVAHPRTVSFWADLQNAAANAIESKDVAYTAGRITARRQGAWLRLLLPSGRSLCYVAPRVIEEDGSPVISYLGQDQYTRKFRRLRTFGGRLVENVTQAVARDVMAANMPRIEDAGYEIVLTCHDEIISEAEDTEQFSAAELSRLLATNPVWSDGLPLAAGGFETYRYRKGD